MTIIEVLTLLTITSVGYTSIRVWGNRDKIKRIYDSIHEGEKNPLISAWKTVQAIYTIKKNEFLGKNGLCINKSDNIYDVQYRHAGKVYKFICKESIPEHLNINAFDENGNDITDVLLQYLGPNGNFHGIDYTPIELGFEKIILLDQYMNQHHFDSMSVIKIPK